MLKRPNASSRKRWLRLKAALLSDFCNIAVNPGITGSLERTLRCCRYRVDRDEKNWQLQRSFRRVQDGVLPRLRLSPSDGGVSMLLRPHLVTCHAACLSGAEGQQA